MSVTLDSLPLGYADLPRPDRTWTERPSRLKFSFAGVLLFSVKMRALVREPSAYGLITADLGEPPDRQTLPAGVRAARIRSLPVTRRLPRLSLLDSWIRYALAQYSRFYIDVDGAFTGYLSKFGSKSRNTLRRKLRQFREGSTGDTGLREFRTPDDIRLFHRLAHSVSTTTYQHQLLDAGIPGTPEFEKELILAASRDSVRGYLLLHSGNPVAYALCRRAGDTLVYDRTGFNPRFAHLHPGTVLNYLMIEHLFEQREVARFDFGPGEFPYKEYFATGNVQCADVYFFPRTFANYALVTAHAALDFATRTAKLLFNRLGWTFRIKKAVHRLLCH